MQTDSIPEQEIRAQLEAMLKDSDFTASVRLRNFFRFIVEETLAGHAAQLKAYTIATTVFGRGEHFDPLQDSVVRVETAKLRGKLLEYYSCARNPGHVRIEVPKGTYVPVFSRFAPQPRALAPEDAGAGPGSDWAAGIQEKPGRILPAAQISIAVLPFTNYSDDNLASGFVDGLLDEIVVALTRFEDLTVASSHAARQLNAAGAELPALAEKLGVRFLVHGTVQSQNKVARIRVELADAYTGAAIWAGRFDAKIAGDDVFRVQEELAQQLVSRIGDSFGSIRRRLIPEVRVKPDHELEVYEALLHYHHWTATFNPVLFRQAREALEKALAENPEDPSIIATLADLYCSDYQFGYDTVPDALNRSQELAMRALSLDATSQTAYFALSVLFFLRRNRVQFENAVQQTLRLNPANSYMLLFTGLMIGLAGDLEAGLRLMARSMELNPASPGWLHVISFIRHYRAGEYEAAANEAILVNMRGCFWDPMIRATAYGRLGNRAEAQAAVAELLGIQPDFVENYDRYVHTLAMNDEIAADLVLGLTQAGLDL